MNILVTGAAGFIGSDFCRLSLEKFHTVCGLDALTYSGNYENLVEIEQHPHFSFVHGRIEDALCLSEILSTRSFDIVVNFAAETHVDRSIMDSTPFSISNVVGTSVLLEQSKKYGVKRFIQISTDEVYGSAKESELFTETHPIIPSSPYSASKAGSDFLALSFWKTFRFETIVTRCSNNFGPRQFPEKLIPLMIVNALEDRSLPVYGDGLNIRDWIYVRDHNSAILKIIENGRPGEIYNIGADQERSNIEVIKSILQLTDKPHSLITYVDDRPGHDRRYAIDASKLKRELNWSPTKSFESGLLETVEWYRNNNDWCNNVRNGSYQSYYQKQYQR